MPPATCGAYSAGCKPVTLNGARSAESKGLHLQCLEMFRLSGFTASLNMTGRGVFPARFGELRRFAPSHNMAGRNRVLLFCSMCRLTCGAFGP